jgi:uncharacterized membrane protein
LATISDAKTLGGLGSILVLLTPIPYAGWALGIAGFVMTLIAVKYISDIVKDQKIFNDMLISVVLTIAAIVVGTVVVLGAVFRVLGMGSFVGGTFVLSPNITPGNWIGLGAAVFAGLAVVWGILIASSVFLRRSYNTVGTKLNVNTFGTAGLLFIIGAATSVILVGFLLILVAQIMLAIAFFSINERTPIVTQAQQPMPTPGGNVP